MLHPSLRLCSFSQDLRCSSVTSWVTFVGGKGQVFTVFMTFSMWLPATTFQGPARVVMSQKKRLNTVTFIMFPAISETLGCTAVVCCKHESKKKFVGTTCHTKGVVSITTVGVDLQFKHRCEKTQLCHTGDAIVICVTVSTTCGRTSHWLCTSASVHRCDRP